MTRMIAICKHLMRSVKYIEPQVGWITDHGARVLRGEEIAEGSSAYGRTSNLYAEPALLPMLYHLYRCWPGYGADLETSSGQLHEHL
jgi:hypothetical protein